MKAILVTSKQSLPVAIATGNTLIRNKLIVLFSALAVLVCFVLTQTASAEEASSSGGAVKKYNITFPISTLGNCASLEECKAYCQDPTNKEACINFAKSKGFYKAPQGTGNAKIRLVIEKAKTELGCTSEQQCREFCAQKENISKCAEFAKKYFIENGKKKLVNNAVLEKAKAILGCESEEACKALCKLEENREKCSQFAKSAGLIGGMVKVASGGAEFNKVKQIMEKCAKDPAFCGQNAGQIEKQLMGQSEEFCKSNPDKCKEMFRKLEASHEGKPGPNFKAYENANPNAKFCQENPEKCKNASGADSLKEKPKKLEIQKQGQKPAKPEVQGAQRTPSFFEWFFNVFLK